MSANASRQRFDVAMSSRTQVREAAYSTLTTLIGSAHRTQFSGKQPTYLDLTGASRPQQNMTLNLQTKMDNAPWLV